MPRLAALLLLLAGCAVAPDPASPWYPLPTGSRLVLTAPVAVPEPGVSVWIQDGRVGGGVDSWEAACKLEMWTRTGERRRVEPDTFTVTRVERDMTQLARPDPLRRVSADENGGPMAFIMNTFIYLHSPRQPDVYRLACTRWDDPLRAEQLSIHDIQRALGWLFRVELPAAEPA